ncbi:abscisic acid-deficient protein Aba4 family protein [Loktanella sp. DJP18]|uniref:abscisic acid-deficient protein Aba4 family protein n=1 Tax=Loktanella sp. DJP18 TaxID=3409788 RepID=UPI003BB65992
MSPETLFSIASTLVLPGWAILVLAPRRSPALNAVPAMILPMVLSAGYAALVMQHFAGAGGGFGSLAAVRALMANDGMLLAGWVHYFAFDLIAGSLAAAAMDRAGVSRLIQAPILIATFLLGPLGWLTAMLVSGGLQATSQTRRAV